MVDKRRFGAEYNQHGRVVDPGVFSIIIILLGLGGYKIIITNKRASLVIHHFISSASSKNNC